MSPNVGNFVHDLVEMAKAMETLPQVQVQLDDINRQNSVLNNEIDRLKADLEQSRNYAASLEQRNRDLEVARDDAELRFLELDEKADKVVAKLASITSLAHDASMVIEPPKPQPEPVVERAMDPTESSLNTSGIVGHDSTTSIDPVVSESSSQPSSNQGQGEGNPTVTVNQAELSRNATNSAVVEVGSQEVTKPYSGRLYVNTPGWVSREDWRNGGGTDESYDWRHSSPTLPEGITSTTA